MDKCCGCRISRKETKEDPPSVPSTTTLVRQDSGVSSSNPSLALVSRDCGSDAEESDEREGEGDSMDEEEKSPKKEKS